MKLEEVASRELDRKGWIFQINASNGGVPKLAQQNGQLTAFGLVGDRHEDGEHHGGLERAVSLYALEHILALQAEGHPIYPGAIGENLTISGLDWRQVEPGLRLRLGDETLIEITSYISPCTKIGAYFLEGYFGRISQQANPGWSRLCARVLQTGPIRIGDPVFFL